MKKALIVLTSHNQLGDTGKATGFWLSELTHPYYALVDRGVDVDIVSIAGGEAPVDPGSFDEKDEGNERFLTDAALTETLKNSQALADVEPGDYDAIVFAGGHGTMWDFPDSPDVQSKAVAIYEQGGVVAAICHGPAALVNMKLRDGSYLVAGKQVAGFSNEEEAGVGLTEAVPFLLQDKLIEAGADYVEQPAWSEHVVVDQRLVTGQNPQSAAAVGAAVAELLQH